MPYLMPEAESERRLLQSFGLELRRARHAAGLSQVMLAARSGVSQSMISRMENGRAPAASVLNLLRLGSAIGRALPLGACPHRHYCPWPPLSAHGSIEYQHESIPGEDIHGLRPRRDELL